eukprot:CAMPEP_0194509436 /NCGR_PEP_ID=MMETSP0253-20130528/40204_1 /TAXON_ID=2966 /ORGANISM="Noctiluca scintillans" /LENGTH=204 /DNA_ID=CAMNT_0039352589 /DNA_START=152 /DNA_END=767 /DNA_ORIENTATION=+
MHCLNDGAQPQDKHATGASDRCKHIEDRGFWDDCVDVCKTWHAKVQLRTTPMFVAPIDVAIVLHACQEKLPVKAHEASSQSSESLRTVRPNKRVFSCHGSSGVVTLRSPSAATRTVARLAPFDKLPKATVTPPGSRMSSVVRHNITEVVPASLTDPPPNPSQSKPSYAYTTRHLAPQSVCVLQSSHSTSTLIWTGPNSEDSKLP